MTDEENEQIPKLKVMTSSDAAKALADADVSDADKEEKHLDVAESQINELPKSESVKEESPVNDYKSAPEARTSGGIGPSNYSPDPVVMTSEGIGPSDNSSESKVSTSGDTGSSSNYETEPIDIKSSDDSESFELPSEYTDGTDAKKKSKKPKIDMNLSSSSLRPAIKGMISFFTIKKMDVGQMEMDEMENNFHFAPIIGAMMGVVLMMEMFILYLLNYYVNFPLGPIIAITVLGTVLIGSKFLHFDGLVDFGDGMVASGDQKKHITAMKDTNVGAGGIGLALVVTIATLALYSIAVGWNDPMFFALFFIIPATEILIKHSMVCAAATGTPGDGMASNQVKKADTDTMFKSTGISAIFLIISLVRTTVVIWIMNWIHLRYWAGPLIGNFSFFFIASFVAIVIGLIVSMGVGTMMSKLSDRTFGSTNGDVLGATNEVARPIVAAAMLLIFLIIIKLLNMI
ncbi:MAG TPA: adenosylcobinamide-GDP ribazoletransferase [Candidatus Methanomethylophilaceae archaeon]|nr:adenosylcobinamide-GDP ribazoletransferase [Candidatus Methanomethylophilaceae archaeon]